MLKAFSCGMRLIYRFWVVRVWVAVCLVSPALVHAFVPDEDPAVSVESDPGILDAEETRMLELINAYRAEHGLAPLANSVKLSRAAHWMSTDMATRDYFDHTNSQGRNPFARMAEFGYKARRAAAENIAAGDADAAGTLQMWKESPGHNENILNPAYRSIGVARVFDGNSTYGWYWTTPFGSDLDPTVATPAPAPVTSVEDFPRVE